MSQSPDIFLSYSREDQVVARRFAEAFESLEPRRDVREMHQVIHYKLQSPTDA